MILPHTVTISVQAANISTGSGTSGKLAEYSANATQPDPNTAKVQCTPEKFSTVFEKTGLEITRPWLIIGKVSSLSLFTGIGDKVTYGSHTLYIKTYPEVFTGIGAADHFSVYLSEAQP